MIEHYCSSPDCVDDTGGRILSITYDDFSALNLRSVSSISLNDHVNEILKRGVPQLATAIAEQVADGRQLRDENKGLLRWYVDEYLSDLSRLQLDSVLKTLRTKSQVLKDLFTDATQLYNTFIKVLQLEEISPTKPVDEPRAKRSAISAIHVLTVFVRLAREFDYTAVYVLVDKVDETEATAADSKKAAVLVTPLLTNMKLLELEGFAMKFFLWENIRDKFGQELRTDRVTMKNIEWSPDELTLMLEKRVLAYSNNETEWHGLFAPNLRDKVMSLIIRLAYKSPRDANRLMEIVFAEAAPDSTSEEYQIKSAALTRGLDEFSKTRAHELYTPEVVEKIAKLKMVSFTIADVAATYKITSSTIDDVPNQTATNRARNMVEKWKTSGVIRQGDPVLRHNSKNRGRSVNQYSIVDPRVIHLVDQKYIAEQCGLSEVLSY